MPTCLTRLRPLWPPSPGDGTSPSGVGTGAFRHEGSGSAGSHADGTPIASRSLAWWKNAGFSPSLPSAGKDALLPAVFIWVALDLPRFRYDQVMHLGWKVMLGLAGVRDAHGGQHADALTRGDRFSSSFVYGLHPHLEQPGATGSSSSAGGIGSSPAPAPASVREVPGAPVEPAVVWELSRGRGTPSRETGLRTPKGGHQNEQSEAKMAVNGEGGSAPGSPGSRPTPASTEGNGAPPSSTGEPEEGQPGKYPEEPVSQMSPRWRGSTVWRSGMRTGAQVRRLRTLPARCARQNCIRLVGGEDDEGNR